MTRAPRTIVWVVAAILLTAISTGLAASAFSPDDELPPATDTGDPVSSSTTTTTGAAESEVTTTTVPAIEALIPLTVTELAEEVAQSVGFVLSQQGTGSGVVISEDLLVTNAHVAWPDRTVSLVFRNGATFQGRVLALDPFLDLAVVDISRLSRKPPPISIGSVRDLEVGDELFAVGYPLPDEFTPEPTVDSGEILGFTDWEFTGAEWLTISAPAISGQSGGAIVDEFGRLVGISTFGSSDSLTSISIDDVVVEVGRLLAASDVRGLEPRLIPHGGARRSNDVELEGEWDQQLLFGWFSGASDVAVEWSGSSGDLTAMTIAGVRIASDADLIQFDPILAFPVVVAAEADGIVSGAIDSSLPLIAYEDPDHGQVLERRGAVAGMYEVGRDRDFFYLDVDAGEEVTVTVESAARTRLVVHSPSGDVIAEDVDMSGFIASNAALRFEASESGRHIVSVESSMSTVSGYIIVTE